MRKEKVLLKATWSDTDSKESESLASKNARYNPNDFLAFIASAESMHDNDIDDEFTDYQKAKFLNNLVVEHEKMIKNYLRDHNILEALKTNIDVLKEEKTNYLRKLDFLMSSCLQCCYKHMMSDKTYFTSLETYNGSTVIFGDGSLAHVKGKGSIAISSCPKLDGVFYVDELKANLLSISQMCENELRVNFPITLME
ncbi:hypothetical protein AAG906_027961 [Vitis piasezkii]